MDKNMINIDELVRQRLQGGEEIPRSGAWLNMRDLLDEKMPVTPPKGGFNLRNFYGILIGVFLCTSATIVGYQFFKKMNNTDATVFNSSKNELGIAANFNQIKATSTPLLPTNDRDISSNNMSINTASNTVDRNGSNKENEIKEANSQEHKSSISKNHNNHINANIALDKNQLTGNISKIAQPIIQNQLNPIVKHNRNQQNKMIASNAGKEAIHDIIQPSFEDNENTNTPTNLYNASATPKQLQPAPLKPQTQKDTFKQLQIVKKFIINPITHESKVYLDTISVGKIALDRNILDKFLPIEEPITASNNTDNEVVDPTLIGAGINNRIVPLAQYKIKSHKTTYWNARSFNEVVNDFKFNVSQIKFYPGMSLGYNNYLLKNASLNGFQLGFAGMFTLDNWALMTELKYFNRINTSYILDDNYVEAAGPGMQSKVEHYFKFSSLQSIEMPLAMRYTLNRLNIFAGVNTSYFFSINPEEVENVSKAEPITQGTFNAAPSVYVSDFDNRICVGSLLGISYDLLPAMQLDLRANRNLWDNLGTRGGLIVARQIFRVPSFQVSLTYRFSQKSKFPKAR